MTRVLHVLDHSLPMHSGYSFRTRAILKAQSAIGMEVRGITGLRHAADGPPLQIADGITFHRTPSESRGMPGIREWREIGSFASAIEAVCETWCPDIVHAHSPVLCGQAALRVARRRNLPLVYEIRAFWEDAAVGNGTGRENSVKYGLTRKLEDLVVSRAQAVVTICDGLRQDLVERGHDPSRITIMPNGVDLGLFGSAAERDPELVRQLCLTEGDRDCPVIGFIGSFYDYEGLDDLITAMPLLVSKHRDAKLLLVGGGPCEADLRAQAESSPAAASIRFVGRVPHHEVERYYALADILAYPRKQSRLTDLVTPLKPLEAMAQSKVVAASNVGGHRELIEDGRTGVLFTADDPYACARALARLLDHREEWPVMRESGSSHVRSRHDWAKNVLLYRDVYQTLLGGKARRTRVAAGR